ncbi:hypothetical protein ABZ532_20300 [Streptomyces sp. NPDC019396]|uniref:hypothetical protein n=1 Tax=Streptomyces sp. NPDC019396 TaxID=3154687 RepID=UPI0033FC847E
MSLMDAHTIWRRLPFPPFGSTRELKLLRADLGEADEHAMVIEAFMRTGVFRPSGADVIAELEDVIARADALCAEYAGSDLVAAREVHAYATLLAIAYRGFLKAGESS